MLGPSSALTVVLGAAPDPTDHAAMRHYVRALCNAGLAVLFIQPGTKEPSDCRSGQKKTTDDAAAREAAREAGRRDWQEARSPAGLDLATSDATWALRYYDRYITRYTQAIGPDFPVSLAVEVGRSGLVVVDCDTAEQVAEFLHDMGVTRDIAPTVSSPGKRNADGTWVHRDGGHFYFTLPDGVELPTELGAATFGNTGWTVLWHQRYVLIPPSVRAEGSYVLAGRDHPLPDRLTAAVTERCEARRAQRERRANLDPENGMSASIDAWAETRPWETILSPLDWTPTAMSDNCGCPIWTAPGDHASPKSATAHDGGCSSGRYSEINAPLHIWTTNPGPEFEPWTRVNGQTMTRLTAVALTEFGGDTGRAIRTLGLDGVGIREGTDTAANMSEPETSHLAEEDASVTPPPTPPPVPAERIAVGGDPQPAADEDFPEIGTTDTATGLYIPRNAGMVEIAPYGHWRDMPPPEFLVEGLMEHGGLSAIIGQPNVGKSTVALDMACHIATGRSWQGRRVLKTRVLYLPGEGLPGVVQRVGAWCESRDTDVHPDLLLGRSIIQLGATVESWAELRAYIAGEGIGLIIFDTLARMATGMEENSATDMGRAIRRFGKVQEMTGCGVTVVHHTGKSTPDVARGSGALNGALETELLVTGSQDRELLPDGRRFRRLEMHVTKQKNAERPDGAIDLMMVGWQDRAPIITGMTGSVDPMQGDIVLAPPVPEPLVETAVRIRLACERFTEQGLTRAEIAQRVDPDPYTLRSRNVVQAWKFKVAEAIDRGMRYGLIVTLTGTPSGARYIPGQATAEQARIAAATEADDDGSM